MSHSRTSVSRSISATLTTAALTAAVAACGGSSSGSSDSGLPKPQLLAKVDAICKTAQTAAKAVPAPASFADATTAATYFDKIAPITAKETDDLVALKPADDVKAVYAKFTSAQKSANSLLQTIKDKADAKDRSGLQDLAKVAPAGQRVSAAAKQLGAKGCG